MGAVCGIAKVAYSGYWHNVCNDIDTKWNFTHFCVLGVARMSGIEMGQEWSVFVVTCGVDAGGWVACAVCMGLE